MADTKHYTELGLTNTRDIFKKAMVGGYAIPAYNFNNIGQRRKSMIDFGIFEFGFQDDSQ